MRNAANARLASLSALALVACSLVLGADCFNQTAGDGIAFAGMLGFFASSVFFAIRAAR